jgi:hypothetical protein
MCPPFIGPKAALQQALLSHGTTFGGRVSRVSRFEETRIYVEIPADSNEKS